MEKEVSCKFCNESVLRKSQESSFASIYSCPNCGEYIIEDISTKVPLENRHLVSGLIRGKNDLGLKLETITQENIASLFSDISLPKTIMQKLDKLLLYYYKLSESLGKEITDNLICYSRGYAKNVDEYIEMISALCNLDYLSGNFLTGDPYHFSGALTLNGIFRAEELSSTNLYSNKVFVAMGFKPDLLKAHEEAIKPACKECGFEALLVIEQEHNDDITDRIIAEIKTSNFVITDFTYNNQGAYFEAGFAQGRGLQVIRTCKKEWFEGKDEKGNPNRVHFDINHYNFILWESHSDLKEKLINRIKATII